MTEYTLHISSTTTELGAEGPSTEHVQYSIHCKIKSKETALAGIRGVLEERSAQWPLETTTGAILIITKQLLEKSLVMLIPKEEENEE